MARKVPGVEDIDQGFTDRMMRIISLGKSEVRVGWTSGRPKHPKGGTPIAKVAGVIYGTRRMKKLVDSNSGKIDDMTRDLFAEVRNGTMGPARALLQLGQMIERELIRDIRQGVFGRPIQKHTGALLEEIKTIALIKTGGRGRPRRIVRKLPT